MRRAAPVLAFILLAGVPARGENVGTTAAPVLQIPMGARASGMGTAFTGLASDINALYYNPAGLSVMPWREAAFMFLKGIDDQSIQHFALGGPIPFSGLIGEGYTSMGGSILIASHGDIEINRLNPDGTLGSSESREAGSDLVATLGYSERVATFEVPIRRDTIRLEHTMGVNGKYIRSTLAESYRATAFAGDLGYLIRAPDQGFGIGAAILNMGPKMTFIEEGDPLPLTYRAGVSWRPRLPETMTLPARQELTLVGDAVYLARERAWRGMVGAEWAALRQFAVRLGYRLNDEVAGFTVGFGAGISSLSVDYAWNMTDALSNTHRFAFTWRFGRVPDRDREKRRKPFIESMPEREDLKGIEEKKPDLIDQPQRPRREVPENRRGAPGWIY
ncbi:MAG: PorV/PorQ family protein [Elusimicrobia bacterium]|nr:PorV/PorQ family protein [Elusimicrobiota bacterium]